MEYYCPKCKKTYSYGINFCPVCGTKIIIKESEQEIYKREHKKIDPYVNKIRDLNELLYRTHYNYNLFTDLYWKIDYTSYHRYDEKITNYLYRTAKSRNLPWVDKVKNYDVLRTYLLEPISDSFIKDVNSMLDELIAELKRLLELASKKDRRTFIDYFDKFYDEIMENYDKYQSLKRNPPRGKIEFFIDVETIAAIDEYFPLYFNGGKKTITFPDLGIHKKHTYEFIIEKGLKAYLNSLFPNPTCTDEDLKKFFLAVDELDGFNDLLKYGIRYFSSQYDEISWRYNWTRAIPQRCEKRNIG